MEPVSRSKKASSIRSSRASAEAPTDPTAMKEWLTSENARLTKSLATANELSERIAEENQSLQQELRDKEQESFEVGEHLRKELADSKHKAAELAERMAKAEAQAERQLAEVQQQHADEQKRAQAKEAEVTVAMQQHVQELEARLVSVAGFKEQQGSIAREMHFLRAERDKVKRELAEQAKAHSDAQLQQRQEMQQVAETRVEAIAAEQAMQLDSRLDAYSAQLAADNQRLKAELKLHAEESVHLETELKALRESQKQLQREVSLQQDLEQRYSKRGATQARDIQAAKKEAEALAAKLRLTDATFQAQLQQLRDENAKERAVTEAEIDTLRRALELKARELKHLKQLSQLVLQQRNDIERFLLSSIEQVQAEIAAGNTARGRAMPTGTVSTHIDLADLSWEDREKVLRLLFAKLHDPVQQKFFEDLPAHVQA